MLERSLRAIARAKVAKTLPKDDATDRDALSLARPVLALGGAYARTRGACTRAYQSGQSGAGKPIGTLWRLGALSIATTPRDDTWSLLTL